MDGVWVQREPKGSRQSPYPRAPSRSSTTTTSSSHTHRYHHSRCGSSTTSTAPPVSSLLQERLQKSRKADNSRPTTRSNGDLSASTGDIRAAERIIQSSPVRRSATAMGRRPRSNSDDEAGNKGIGAKEMEQMLSTMHKQNFDLKLELFHRRERQTELEEKNRQLESERAEMTELQDNLLAELESRDKAVGEAVAMIIDLEERVEELVREREMVRIVEADGPYRNTHSKQNDASAPDSTTPKMSPRPAPYLIDQSKTLDRMPSFLSERTERTQNLRNVVLGNKSSLLHMRNVSGSSVDPSESNRITSPSLSILSESSFVSIYGDKTMEDAQAPVPQPRQHQPVPDNSDKPNNLSTPGSKLSNEGWESQRSKNTLTRMPKDIFKGGVGAFSQIQSLNNILDISSPLQQLELLEKKLSVEDSSQPSTSSHGKGQGNNTPSPSRARPVPQIRTKQEKREALRKVATSSPDHTDFANSHVLPPTPDTISTSTLRRYQNSNDNLFKERLTAKESFQLDNLSASARGLRPNTSRFLPANPSSQPASATASTGRINAPLPQLDADVFANLTQLAQTLPQRPRSADDTTISRPRANSWISDSDDSDGGVDARSEDSNFDYWMRESAKPNPHDRGSHAQPSNNRSASPDLFSFPDGGHGWETDALFGAMRGSGFLGSPVSALKRDPLDEVAATLTSPQAAVYQPPDPNMPDGGVQPPNRRSSLHARTGSLSSSVVPPAGGKLRKSPIRSDSATRTNQRARSNSIDSAIAVPPPKMQLRVQTDVVPAARRNQYPPIAGQPTKSKGPGGLYGLFRRSGSESRSVPASATDPSFPPEQVQQVQQPHPRFRQEMPAGRSSVPPQASSPWAMVAPAVFDDDLMSATPPPIMRNRAPLQISQLGMDGGGLDDASTPHQPRDGAPEVGTPDTVVGPGASSTPQGVGKRKWLGLGRRGSLKNRTG